MKGRTITLEGFSDLCERVSGKDLKWFFNQWFKTDGYLDYRIKNVSVTGKPPELTAVCAVERQGEAVMPLEIAALKDGVPVYKIKTAGNFDKKTVRLGPVESLDMIEIDPENRLPLYEKALRSIEANIYAASRYHDEGLTVKALDILLPFRYDRQTDAEYWYLLGSIYFDTGNFKAAGTCFKRFFKMVKSPRLERRLKEAREKYRLIKEYTR